MVPKPKNWGAKENHSSLLFEQSDEISTQGRWVVWCHWTVAYPPGSQPASPCSMCTQNTGTSANHFLSHEKTPRLKVNDQLNSSTNPGKPTSRPCSSHTGSYQKPDSLLPFFFHLIKLFKLKFWFFGVALLPAERCYQVRNELCLLAFKTCIMPQLTWPHLTLLSYLSPFFHQTKLLSNSIIVMWFIIGL